MPCVGIECDTNNPLGLTVAGPGYGNPNAFLYPGQIGAQTSGLGYTFAAFPTPQAGIAAGIDYITRKIQSGAVATVGQLVNLFSPGDQAAFTQTTGLGANAPLDASQAGTYAAGIAAGEGTLSGFGGTSAFTTGTSAAPFDITAVNGGASGVGSDPFGLFGTGVGGAPSASAPASSTQATGSDPFGIGKAIVSFESWIGNATGSVVFVLLGLALLVGGFLVLANEQGWIEPGAVKAAVIG